MHRLWLGPLSLGGVYFSLLKLGGALPGRPGIFGAHTGAYAFDAPYGGARGDVSVAFPDVNDSDKSGFALAYAYSTLPAGSHTISAAARDLVGETKDSQESFDVVKFKEDFISNPSAVDLDEAACSASADEFLLTDALVSGDL